MDNAPLVDDPIPVPVDIPAPGQTVPGPISPLTVDTLKTRLALTETTIEQTKSRLSALYGARSTYMALIKEFGDGN